MILESLETAKMHLKRAKFAFNQLQKIDLNLEVFKDEEKIETIDAFIFRFTKLQDFMGDKIFRETLEVLGEYKNNMSLLDVLDKLEKLELLPDSDRWKQYRQTRNNLAHEYPDNEQDIIKGLKEAFEYFIEIEKILQNIEIYLTKINK